MFYITKELNELGMDEKLKGFIYSCSAVNLILKQGFFIKIEIVYFNIAKEYNITDSSVERSIRYAIEKTWEKGNVDKINEVFGYSIDKERGKPTNREFLFMLADRIKNICE